MKFKLQMLSMLVVTAFPILASAQEESKERAATRRANMQRAGAGTEVAGFPGGPMGMSQMLPLMKALDTNQDGTLSASEIANASKALIQLDKNGDGVLNAEEMRPDPSAMPGGFAGARGQPSGQMMGKLFEARDKNGDGKLTGDEIPERLQDKMKMIDKDGDGSITKAEFALAAARMDDGAVGKKGAKDGNTSGGVKPKRPTE